MVGCEGRFDWARAHESAQQDEGPVVVGCMPISIARKVSSGGQARLPGVAGCGVAIPEEIGTYRNKHICATGKIAEYRGIPEIAPYDAQQNSLS
jgi:hypothetical protein